MVLKFNDLIRNHSDSRSIEVSDQRPAPYYLIDWFEEERGFGLMHELDTGWFAAGTTPSPQSVTPELLD
jgi:hypothetical protein